MFSGLDRCWTFTRIPRVFFLFIFPADTLDKSVNDAVKHSHDVLHRDAFLVDKVQNGPYLFTITFVISIICIFFIFSMDTTLYITFISSLRWIPLLSVGILCTSGFSSIINAVVAG